MNIVLISNNTISRCNCTYAAIQIEPDNDNYVIVLDYGSTILKYKIAPAFVNALRSDRKDEEPAENILFHRILIHGALGPVLYPCLAETMSQEAMRELCHNLGQIHKVFTAA